MKRILLLILILILTLTGCAVNSNPDLECVADTISYEKNPKFYFDTDLPAEAVLTSVCDDGCCALFTYDECEIYQEIISAEKVEAAFVSITGQNMEQLAPLKVSSFPYDEYRFAWTAAGEGGTYSCSGKLYFDGEYCYALTVRCPEALKKSYETVFLELFAEASLEAV